MRYFDYQTQGTIGMIWGIFAPLGMRSEDEMLSKSRYSCSYSHTLEIVNAALNGSLSYMNDDFDLARYESKCATNERIGKRQEVDKLLYIVDSTEEEDNRVGYGDISERALGTKEDVFEGIESEDTLDSGLCQLSELREKYIKEIGKDIVSILRSSLRGIPEATIEIQGIMSKDSFLREVVINLCESSNGTLMSRLQKIM